MHFIQQFAQVSLYMLYSWECYGKHVFLPLPPNITIAYFLICNWILEKLPVKHKDKYLEIRNSIIQ